MGNFYCNFTTRGPSVEDVVRLLEAERRSAFISWLVPLAWFLLEWPPLLFEHLHHLMLAKLLGIPTWCVASGYRYITRGENPLGLTASELRRTGQRL